MKLTKLRCDVPVAFPWNPCVAKPWDRILTFTSAVAPGVASAMVSHDKLVTQKR
jgi:hypothetical protein